MKYKKDKHFLQSYFSNNDILTILGILIYVNMHLGITNICVYICTFIYTYI